MKAKIIPIQKKWLIKKEAMEYIGLRRDSFDNLISKEGLTISACSQKMKWYKVQELDDLIERNIIIKKAAANG